MNIIIFLFLRMKIQIQMIAKFHIAFWMRLFCLIYGGLCTGRRSFSPGLFYQSCKVLHKQGNSLWLVFFYLWSACLPSTYVLIFVCILGRKIKICIMGQYDLLCLVFIDCHNFNHIHCHETRITFRLGSNQSHSCFSI